MWTNSIKPFKRSTRLSNQIKKILSSVFLKEVIIPDSIISITDVKLSKDIKVADIYISIFNSNHEKSLDILKLIISRKKDIKYKMGLALKAKYVPDIKFLLDNSMKSYDEINILLKK